MKETMKTPKIQSDKDLLSMVLSILKAKCEIGCLTYVVIYLETYQDLGWHSYPSPGYEEFKINSTGEQLIIGVITIGKDPETWEKRTICKLVDDEKMFSKISFEISNRFKKKALATTKRELKKVIKESKTEDGINSFEKCLLESGTPSTIKKDPPISRKKKHLGDGKPMKINNWGSLFKIEHVNGDKKTIKLIVSTSPQVYQYEYKGQSQQSLTDKILEEVVN